MKRASEAVTLHAGGIARATVVGNADGGCTRSEDPALSCLLRRDPSSLKLRRDTRAAVTPVPLAVWLSPPQRFALVVSPAIPADTLSAGRPHKTAHAPRQRLAQAGAGSTRLRRASTVSSVRLRQGFAVTTRSTSLSPSQAPHRLFQQQTQSWPAGPSVPPSAGKPHAVRRRASGFALRASP
jgi:hypothetical protein